MSSKKLDCPGTPDHKIRKALFLVLDRLDNRLKDKLHNLIDEAPAPIVGRDPSEEDLAMQMKFKNKAINFLKSLPPESGITYQAVMKQLDAELTKRDNVTKKNGEKTSQIVPELPRPESALVIPSFTSNLLKSPKKSHKKKKKAGQTVAKKEATRLVDYLCLLDFMATCNDGPPPKPQEIIEFPALLLNVETGEVEGQFHCYVRPDVHQQLSPYCIELTGITQDQVDGGISVLEALEMHQAWLDDHALISLSEALQKGNNNGCTKRTFLYTICGDWDLKVCLPNQLQHQNKQVPASFQSWINIKWPFENMYHKMVRGIADMLSEMGLSPDSTTESGLDDCRNLAQICQKMIKHGWVPNPTAGEGCIGTKLFWQVQSRRPWPPQADPISPYKMIYLIRNGESEAEVVNNKERLTNWDLKDCGLTERGVQQSKDLPKLLGDHLKTIELIVTSPLKKALQTALLGFTDKDILVNYGLVEIGRDTPENSPKPMDQILTELDSDIKSRNTEFILDCQLLKPKNWPQSAGNESPVRRIHDVFEWIYMDCKEQTIAVVCHSNVIRTAIYGANAPVAPDNASPLRCKLFMNGNLVPI